MLDEVDQANLLMTISPWAVTCPSQSIPSGSGSPSSYLFSTCTHCKWLGRSLESR